MATTKVSTKLLETVGVAEGGTGAVSSSAARTSLGLVIGTNVLAPDGSAASLTNLPAAGASAAEAANIMLNSFRISVNGGLTFQNMVDGVVDEFEDETGVDLPTSTNESYDATNDYYRSGPGGGSTLIAQSSGTVLGNMVNGGGLAAAFDGDNDENIDNSALLNGSGPAYCGKDWGSGNDRVVTSVKTWGSNNFGYEGGGSGTDAHTITLSVEGSTDNFSSSVVDLGGSISFADAASANTKTLTTTSTTAYRYHRLKITSGGTDSADALAELEFYETLTTVDMTIFSNATTALAAPDDANIVVWEEDVDAITLNTDLKVYASRNGGTTYTQITLAEVANLTTGRVLTGTVDISGQSSATAMKYKIETLNTKDQKIHAVALQWS
jgi:Fe-S cluster assembly iron-binding protein IscA